MRVGKEGGGGGGEQDVEEKRDVTDENYYGS